MFVFEEVVVVPVFVLFLSCPVIPRIDAFKPAPFVPVFSLAFPLISGVLLLPLVLMLFVLVLLLPNTEKDDDPSGERVRSSLLLPSLLAAVERVLSRSLCIAAGVCWCIVLDTVQYVQDREKSSIILQLPECPRSPSTIRDSGC